MEQQELNLVCGPYLVAVSNRDRRRETQLADWDHVHAFGHTDLTATSQHAVTSRIADGNHVKALLLADGGASGVHDHSAIIVQDNCIVAVGPYVACLKIPRLELIWATKADEFTCFGVHWSALHRCLISHGELEIARLGDHGEVVWRAGGADIFTGALTLETDWIDIVDFYDHAYRFDIETGQLRSI